MERVVSSFNHFVTFSNAFFLYNLNCDDETKKNCIVKYQPFCKLLSVANSLFINGSVMISSVEAIQSNICNVVPIWNIDQCWMCKEVGKWLGEF